MKRKPKLDMTWGGAVCPVEPKHGTLILLDSGKWHCPHSAHVRCNGQVIEASAFIFDSKQVQGA